MLARRDPSSWRSYEWTGAEPEGLYDLKMAEFLGATWEGDELVTYNLTELHHNFEHFGDQYLYDPD